MIVLSSSLMSVLSSGSLLLSCLCWFLVIALSYDSLVLSRDSRSCLAVSYIV